MKNIERFYDNNVENEWTRLDRHPLEYEITKKLFDKYILNKSNIIDIGGGPGKYSFFLRNIGHDVTLVDLFLKNINFAKNKARELNLNLADYIQANVLDLNFIKDNSFDVVLCMGPLYHILDKKDQKRAINVCLRILKPDGIVYISFITKFAQAICFIAQNPDKIKDWRSYFENVIETGKNHGNIDTTFTDSFFFHPDEIENLMKQFPIDKLEISGIEGLFAQSEEKLKQLDKKLLDEWIDFSFKYSSRPSILGACQHIMYIGRKN